MLNNNSLPIVSDKQLQRRGEARQDDAAHHEVDDAAVVWIISNHFCPG